jgi:phenylacetate-CoA ligase
VTALREQLEYLAASSPFYAERLRGARVTSAADLAGVPFTTKEELREGQRRDPPFGPHLCAPRERLVRMHVTSGTTGEPVAVGFTRADHESNSEVGGEAFRIAGLRPDDIVAHCLNYAFYAGGIADHMAIEASGATVVPVGIGQSRRLLDLIPRLGITALFGTLSFPAYLAGRAREAGIEPRELGLRRIVTAGEPGAGLAALREGIEDTWGADVADTFGMSDIWSTMGGACGSSEGLHLTVSGHAVLELIDPDSGEVLDLEDDARGELVWTHLRREASPLLR